ncbi:Zinc transporter ZIP3 [Trichoplax sp. H2]|nr:Zinc transporter ZIP3 [Trichoplax sp. H2]|eukprot:RDD46400.1 Zinc transporter ZIP3 [Trichoplax sp. H2]
MATNEFSGVADTVKPTRIHGSVIISKVIFVVILFILSFLFAILPLKFKNYSAKANRIIIHYGSCVSSGVFLGTCLLVLLPNVENVLMNRFHTRYPLTHLFVASGFLLAMFIEHSTTSCIEKIMYRYKSYSPAKSDLNTKKKQKTLRNPDSPINYSDESDMEDNWDTKQQNRQYTGHRTIGIILNIILSFHGIFEGFTIGLFNDRANLTTLYVAIMIHKLLVSLGLGIKLVRESFQLREIVICSLIFSATSPIGAAIAISANTHQNIQGNIVSGICIAIATGTFLYITFVEMIPKDLNEIENGRRMLNVFCIIMGFAFIGCITLFLI